MQPYAVLKVHFNSNQTLNQNSSVEQIQLTFDILIIQGYLLRNYKSQTLAGKVTNDSSV